MRSTSVALTITLLSLTAVACGDDDPETAQRAISEQRVPSTAAAAGPVLIATVGSTADADAFSITLTDEAGAAVTSLPAGSYTIRVSDLSSIHNAHLTGPGGLDESTSVPEVADGTWQVTLGPGEHTLVCDPHQKMKVTFSVV